MARLPTPPSEEQLPEMPEVPAPAYEVYLIMHEIAMGCRPETGALFEKLKDSCYIFPGVKPNEQHLWQYDNWVDAWKACQSHVKLALDILAQRRREIDEQGQLVDVEWIVRMFQARITDLHGRLANYPRDGDLLRYEKLMELFRVYNRDMMAMLGRPVVDQIQVKGDPKNPLQHEHRHALLPRDAYTAWDGGTADLGAVTDAEFTEVIVNGALDHRNGQTEFIPEEEE
jgi:hypothetical protein